MDLLEDGGDHVEKNGKVVAAGLSRAHSSGKAAPATRRTAQSSMSDLASMLHAEPSLHHERAVAVPMQSEHRPRLQDEAAVNASSIQDSVGTKEHTNPVP